MLWHYVCIWYLSICVFVRDHFPLPPFVLFLAHFTALHCVGLVCLSSVLICAQWTCHWCAVCVRNLDLVLGVHLCICEGWHFHKCHPFLVHFTTFRCVGPVCLVAVLRCVLTYVRLCVATLLLSFFPFTWQVHTPAPPQPTFHPNISSDSDSDSQSDSDSSDGKPRAVDPSM